MTKVKSIKKGDILIAEPFMLDSNFRRAVICLCDHSHEEGSVGFILNRRLNVKLAELIEEIKTEEVFNVYYGGPVATDTLHYIHNVGELLEGSIKVSRGVYWGGDYEKLKFLINSGLIKPNNIRFYLGYSGWSAGQLDEELETGSWVISRVDPNYIFKSISALLWKQTMANKGDRYSVIAQMPTTISLN
jgi:putative transcriptional regulator